MLRREEKPSGMPHNAIAVGTTIKGSITAEEDYRIDGTVEGDIQCSGKIVVGPQSVITGNITCSQADIFGTVNGNVTLSDNLIIRASGKITGDITTRTLTVEPNAIFSGKCIMHKG
ncbi:MAG: bactofilin family protein [Bacteroidales bacterium]